MNFFKKLFGGSGENPKEKPYVDEHGFYFYVRCAKCGAKVRIRADKQHDFNHEEGGFVWHKTIVDSRCFRPMRAVVHLDGRYQITAHELEGGSFITAEEYAVPERSDTETDTEGA